MRVSKWIRLWKEEEEEEEKEEEEEEVGTGVHTKGVPPLVMGGICAARRYAPATQPTPFLLTPAAAHVIAPLALVSRHLWLSSGTLEFSILYHTPCSAGTVCSCL